VATVSNGVVTNVVITCPGQNYAAGDTVTFAFNGGGCTTAAGNYAYVLQAGDVAANAGGGLTKIGNGTLFLNGVNTYTGTTTVNGGTLAGSGSIAGPVTVASGGTLAVGGSLTALATNTVSGVLTLAAGGTNFMKVNAASGGKDLLTGMSQANYGGTLVVSNLAGNLALGNSFKLYNAASYNGAFGAIVPATPGAGLAWNTSQLTVNGTLSIANAVNTNSTNIFMVVSNGNLNLSWPSDHLGWRLEVQTNSLTQGLGTNWATWPNSTNVTSVAIPLTATNPSVFFRMIYP
jgi:autotransporter-associated beta strand protein